MRQASSNNQTLSYADEQLDQQPEHPRSLWRWLWLAALIVALLLGYTLGHLGIKGASTAPQANTSQQTSTFQQASAAPQTGTTPQASAAQQTSTTPQASTAPQVGQQVVSMQPVVSSQTWTTVFSYQSSGNKQTQVFTAPKSWALQWQCNPASYITKQYNLVVAMYSANGSLVTPAVVNTICKAGNTTDTMQETQAGKIYLDVFSQGAWTLNVQQLK